MTTAAPGPKRFGPALSMLLAIAVGALGAGELTARYFGFGDPPLVQRDDRIEYFLIPSRSYRRFGQDIRVNRYGMRSDDVDLATVDRRLAFSLLGDSIVYGNRLDQRDTLAAQLQSLLAARAKRPDVVVNSIAAASWGPENQLEFYRRFGPFSGHTAFIIQSTHDMIDVIDHAQPPPYATTSYGALHDIAANAWRRLGSVASAAKDDHAAKAEARRRADAALHQLITTTKSHFARVILVFHAERAEAGGRAADGLAHYRAIAGQHGIPFVSTLELYAEAYRAGRPPHYDDIHLSKHGAGLLAERLAAEIGNFGAAD